MSDHIEILHVGFTGTRHGFMPRQREAFLDSINGLIGAWGSPDKLVFHHGDCIGADAQAHAMARELGIPVVVHPPINPKTRAFCTGYADIWIEKEYHERDTDIVLSSHTMYAVPETRYELPGSGTWWTVHYAEQLVPTQQMIVCMIWPDGELEIHHANGTETKP